MGNKTKEGRRLRRRTRRRTRGRSGQERKRTGIMVVTCPRAPRGGDE